MNKAFYLLPLIVLGVLGWMQYQKSTEIIEPELIERPLPEFDLPEFFLDGRTSEQRLTQNDLPNKPLMINIFASWCSNCMREVKYLHELKDHHGFDIYGMAYRDEDKDIRRYLEGLGNPYARIASDAEGHEFVKWKMSGLPQTYLIDRHGRIRYQHSGLISAEDVNTIILPLMAKLQAEP